MTYITRIEEGQGMSLARASIEATLTGVVYWVNPDGSEERAWATSSYIGGDRRKIQAQLNLTVGRLRAYLARTGRRWDVEQREARDLKVRQRKASRAAVEEVTRRCYTIDTAGRDLSLLSDEHLITEAATLMAEARRRAMEKA